MRICRDLCVCVCVPRVCAVVWDLPSQFNQYIYHITRRGGGGGGGYTVCVPKWRVRSGVFFSTERVSNNLFICPCLQRRILYVLHVCGVQSTGFSPQPTPTRDSNSSVAISNQ